MRLLSYGQPSIVISMLTVRGFDSFRVNQTSRVQSRNSRRAVV